MAPFDIRLRAFFVPTVLCVLAACTAPEPGAEFNDPFEEQNRAVHAENVSLDRTLFGGGKPDKKRLLPQPVAEGLGNVADNLSMPGAVVNSVLQGRPAPALRNTFRFAINSTIGIAGIFDPATAMGIDAEDTDFGETLHVWGAPEGAFLVLPVAGPTTERDLAGKVVDVFLDPVGAVVGEPETYYIAAAKLGGKIADRQRFSDTVDSILYESADSYAQMRLLYLQNRDFELGIEADVFDPFEDPYGQ
ncbi:MlaA family lipoprotein [Albidovulum aquaemixtae]|uniref:MlaA family lipoprotein n=1 Tax=Albidovulum aquaemixtae TaxID=1542388 RepID=UPI001FE70515|nr:VacJ family lipoprotein [Defluviimonas aquaemixtae]